MSKLNEFTRQADTGQVAYASKVDPRRKVIVTKKSIISFGNWQNAPAEELQETPALYAAAVADHQTLNGSGEATTEKPVTPKKTG